MLLRTLALSVSLLLLAVPAGAVIIDSGDGTGNTTTPPDDPGWDNVGVRGGWTAVYLRNGWVLSAFHVSLGSVVFDEIEYDMIPGSSAHLDNGDGTYADLKIWGIYPHPPLPDLTIRSSLSQPTGDVILVGNGRDRGATTDTNHPGVWVQPPTPPIPPKTGFLWLSPKTLRWGTNRVAGHATVPGLYDVITESWYTFFDESGSTYTTHEAQAAEGDSGGAVFAKQGGGWQLAGIMHSVNLWPGDPEVPGTGQQANSALYGNATIFADLSFYRDDILTLTAVPEPGGTLMLASGIAFLLAAGRSRMRR
jgi:hypothetical protein